MVKTGYAKRTNRIGPMTEPWGTSYKRMEEVAKVPLLETLWKRPECRTQTMRPQNRNYQNRFVDKKEEWNDQWCRRLQGDQGVKEE